MRPIYLSLTLCVAGAACGNKTSPPKSKQGSGSATPTVAPIAAPTLGVDTIKALNFVYDGGAPAYQKAIAAYKATPRDWAAVQSHCEAALAKDPRHLDAHRLLASALSQQGKPAEATEHFLLVVAADWGKYGATFLADPDLQALRATPHGQALTELLPKLEQNFRARVAAGVWVLGRRSTFKLPTKPGMGWTTPRGELYAYDNDNQRYLRLTHTDHQVAAFVRASGNEFAILTFDKVELPATGKPNPKPGDKPSSKTSTPPALAPTIARAAIQLFDATTFAPLGTKVTVPAGREIRVGYATGDQLIISVAPATDRWLVGAPTLYAVDKSVGKLVATTTAPINGAVLTLDEGGALQGHTGFEPTDIVDVVAARGLMIANSKRAIELPGSTGLVLNSLNTAPDGQRAAFATVADPCNSVEAPSLYVVDNAGTVKHVLTSHSQFTSRWLSPTLLAYQDDDNGVRVWDALLGREQYRFAHRAGLALAALSPGPKPICKTQPPVPAAAGSDAGDIEIESGDAAEPTLAPNQPVVRPN
ncbi:MAG: hypothetical protein KBG15_09030 [Kofleriaceae bacterium]|nr:hypothetical protein [Kofleriaceae bacterium]